MQRRIAHQQEAGVVGDVGPLVEVEGDRLGALEAPGQRLQRGRQRGQRPEGAVDVQPQSLGGGDVGERVEIVEGAEIDRAGGADDQERGQAGGAVAVDRALQDVQPHRAGRIGLDGAQKRRANPGQLHRLAHAAVGLARGVGAKLGRLALQAAGPHAVSKGRVASDQQAQEVGLGCADDEDARAGRRETQRLGRPQRDLALDDRADVVAPAAVGVQRRGDQLGDHADRRPGAVRPAEEARMGVADQERSDQGVDVGQHVLEVARLVRQRIGEAAAHLFRRRPPDRAVGDVLQPAERLVEGVMRRGPEPIPVGWVEGGRVGRWLWRGGGHSLTKRAIWPRSRTTRRDRPRRPRSRGRRRR